MERQEESVSPKPEAVAGAGQRLISVAGPASIPTAGRRLGGQILLPALLTLSKLTLLVFLGYFGAKALIYNVKKKVLLVRIFR